MNREPQFTELELMTLKVLVQQHAERLERLFPTLTEYKSPAVKALWADDLAGRFALLAKF